MDKKILIIGAVVAAVVVIAIVILAMGSSSGTNEVRYNYEIIGIEDHKATEYYDEYATLKVRFHIGNESYGVFDNSDSIWDDVLVLTYITAEAVKGDAKYDFNGVAVGTLSKHGKGSVEATCTVPYGSKIDDFTINVGYDMDSLIEYFESSTIDLKPNTPKMIYDKDFYE